MQPTQHTAELGESSSPQTGNQEEDTALHVEGEEQTESSPLQPMEREAEEDTDLIVSKDTRIIGGMGAKCSS